MTLYISLPIQNHMAAVSTQAAVGTAVTLSHFHASDFAVYVSAFVGICGLILQAIYVLNSIKGQKNDKSDT